MDLFAAGDKSSCESSSPSFGEAIVSLPCAEFVMPSPLTYLIFLLGEGDINFFFDGDFPLGLNSIGGLVLSVMTTFTDRRVVRSERGVCGGKEGDGSLFLGELVTSEVAVASRVRPMDGLLLDLEPLLPLLVLDLIDFLPDVALLPSCSLSSFEFFSYLIFLPANEGRLGDFLSFSSLFVSLVFPRVGESGKPDEPVAPSLVGRFRDDDRRRDGDGCDTDVKVLVGKGDGDRRREGDGCDVDLRDVVGKGDGPRRLVLPPDCFGERGGERRRLPPATLDDSLAWSVPARR